MVAIAVGFADVALLLAAGWIVTTIIVLISLAACYALVAIALSRRG